MAQSMGTATWALPKPKLTKEIIAEKGKMVAEKYQEILMALASAAVELGGQGDALGLKMLTDAAETAIECGVKSCAERLSTILDD